MEDGEGGTVRVGEQMAGGELQDWRVELALEHHVLDAEVHLARRVEPQHSRERASRDLHRAVGGVVEVADGDAPAAKLLVRARRRAPPFAHSEERHAGGGSRACVYISLRRE